MSETIDDEGAEVVATPSTALAVVKTAVSTVLAADKGNILGNLADLIAKFEPDVSTKKGREKIASMAFKVSTSKTALIGLANGLMEADKKRIAAILAERKIIETNMDRLRDEMRAPLDAFEAAEAARIAAHEAALVEIAAMGEGLADLTAEQIAARTWNVPPLDDRHWQEFEQRAERVIATVLDTLRGAHEAAVAREQAAAEVEIKRQAEVERIAAENERKRVEREEQIAANARAQAVMEAEAKADRERTEAALALAEAEKRATRLAEQAEEARINAHKNALAELDAATNVIPGESAAVIRARLDTFLDRPERAWEEFAAVAASDIAAGEKHLRACLESAEKREAEAAKRFRQEAEAQAQREADAAVERERLRVAKDAATRQAEAEARQADEAHRATVISEAAGDMITAMELHFTGSNLEAGLIIQAIIVAITKGQIAHTRIEF